MKCHAGCEVLAIVAAIGLTEQDLFAKQGDTSSERRIVTTYDYIDEGGGLLFQVVRFEPKDFRPRRPDGRGGWIWNLKGIPRVLYRLPRVLTAAKAGGVVWEVEGEKDVAAVEELGLVATTNPGGAQGWHGDYAEAFRGCKGVVILPDNDESGRQHATDVARSLHAAGIPVKIVALPGLVHRGDVSDWIAAGGTKAALLELSKAAPRWTPSVDAPGEALGTKAADGEAADWQPPLPLYTPDVPPFPAEVLPDDLRAYVEAVALATQTPEDLSALVVLAVLATAAAKRAVVEVRDGWREPLNLFTLVVLGPGNRKSAVFRECTEPLTDFEEAEGRRLESEVKRTAARRKVAEKALERAEADAAKAEEEHRAEKLAVVDRLVEELATLPIVTAPRLSTDDVTPEKLAALMAENGERVAVLSAEGGIFGLLAGRYQANGGANLDVFLKGHAGDALAVDRIGREGLRINAPALSVGLTVQPEVLRGLADTPEFRGRGLLARFVFALPVSRVGSRDLAAPTIPDNVRQRYAATVRGLLTLEPALTDSGDPVPHILTLASGAADALRAFGEWLEPQLGDAGELALMVDWGGKLSGAAARIAGLLHLAEHARAQQPWAAAVSAEMMERAVALAHYLIPHARAAFAQMGADSLVEDAQHILGWLRRNRPATVTRRDLFNGTRGRFRTVGKLDRPLGLLEDHGFIRAMALPASSGPGRPPSPSYEVNPATYTQKPQNAQKSPLRGDCADIADSAVELLTGADEVVL
jgi:hypothetical protein